ARIASAVPFRRPIDLPGKLLTVVIGPHAEGQADLLKIADAVDALGLGLGFGKRGQEQTCKDGDDGDDDQQLNQGKRRHSGFADLIHSLVSFFFSLTRNIYLRGLRVSTRLKTVAAPVPVPIHAPNAQFSQQNARMRKKNTQNAWA